MAPGENHFPDVIQLLINKPATVSEILYFRLHGIGPGEVNYKYKYTDDDLKRLLGFVRGYEKTARVVYVMFNNISMGEDAARFEEMITVP